VIVTSEANKYCTMPERRKLSAEEARYKKDELKFLRERLDDVTACYRFITPEDRVKIFGRGKDGDASQVLIVFLNDSVSDIQHGLVRAFGYLVSNYYSHLTVDQKSITWSSDENLAFRESKTAIADAFLKDVSGTPAARRFASLTKLSARSSEGRRNFEDFVYAEAFDSFYCNMYAADSSNTLVVMSKRFHATFDKFVETLKQPQKNQTTQINRAGAFALADDSYVASAGSAVMGGVNWMGQYAADVYHGARPAWNDYNTRIANRVDKIVTQVQQGNAVQDGASDREVRNSNGNSLAWWQWPSVTLNAVSFAGDTTEVYGVAGNYQRTITGDGFSDTGEFETYTDAQRNQMKDSGNIALIKTFGAAALVSGALGKSATSVAGQVSNAERAVGGEIAAADSAVARSSVAADAAANSAPRATVNVAKVTSAENSTLANTAERELLEEQAIAQHVADAEKSVLLDNRAMLPENEYLPPQVVAEPGAVIPEGIAPNEWTVTNPALENVNWEFSETGVRVFPPSAGARLPASAPTEDEVLIQAMLARMGEAQ
jgi:hypothetical protein